MKIPYKNKVKIIYKDKMPKAYSHKNLFSDLIKQDQILLLLLYTKILDKVQREMVITLTGEGYNYSRLYVSELGYDKKVDVNP